MDRRNFLKRQAPEASKAPAPNHFEFEDAVRWAETELKKIDET